MLAWKLTHAACLCKCMHTVRNSAVPINKINGSALQFMQFYTSSRLSHRVIDGNAISKQILDEVKEEVGKVKQSFGRAPHLTAILVGNDPASKTYVRKKKEAAMYTGVTIDTLTPSSSISEDELLSLVYKLNCDDTVDGILVQLPLPSGMREDFVCDAVVAEKDVDGYSTENLGRLRSEMQHLVPCTAAGVIELIRRTEILTFGRNAVVCGRSKNVGLPIAILLQADGQYHELGCDMTTTICHRYTPPEQLKELVKRADIVVSACGVPGLITGDMVKPGVAVIDVGFTHIKDPDTGKQKIVGDVHFDSVSTQASYITPVPGGVGPMTVAMLMKNTLIALQRRIPSSS